MRIHYAEAMTDPAYYAPLAQTAESLGFDGMVIPDSVCYPEESDSKYPYTPDGNREFLDGKPFIEPLTMMAALGAVTSTLTFSTFVYKLPIRHPVLVAKQLSSVAYLNGGRLGFGVGTSPWPEDYSACDVPWERRGKRMDEMIDIIRGLCTGEYFSYDGEIFQVESMKICPVPEQPVPILLGGHHEAALKRAAKRCDGWMHAGGDAEDLAPLLARLSELRVEYGTADKPFQTFVISMDAYSPAGLASLEASGVTDVVVGFRNSYEPGPDTQPLDEKVAMLNWYASEVLAKR